MTGPSPDCPKADECSLKGLSKNIRLEMSEKKPVPYQKVGNTSTVILGNVGTSMALQDLTGILQGNGSLVTMPIDSWTSNDSSIAAS